MKDIDSVIKSRKNAFYAFDAAVLRKRIGYLQGALPDNVELCYAVKANTFITGELKDVLSHFEICSAGEAQVCLTLGVDKRKMVISGVYKDAETIDNFAADPENTGIITAESLGQYTLICDAAQKYQRKLRVLPRLTNGSQFGMNAEDIERIITEQMQSGLLEIVGIQFFSGTQKTSVKKLRREIEHLDAFLLHLRDDLGFTSSRLEYGGGFPVSYFTCDEFDEPAYLAEFSEIIGAMKFRTRIVLELGRSIAASCGKYYTRIVDIKYNKSQNYAITDGGMHQLVYFGQAMAMKQPFLSVVGKPDIVPDKPWLICGAICSMNDIIVKNICLPDISAGDTLCFENTGAYCAFEGASLFLTRDIPAVYIIKENGEAVCVREMVETAELNTPRISEAT